MLCYLLEYLDERAKRTQKKKSDITKKNKKGDKWNWGQSCHSTPPSQSYNKKLTPSNKLLTNSNITFNQYVNFLSTQEISKYFLDWWNHFLYQKMLMNCTVNIKIMIV